MGPRRAGFASSSFARFYSVLLLIHGTQLQSFCTLLCTSSYHYLLFLDTIHLFLPIQNPFPPTTHRLSLGSRLASYSVLDSTPALPLPLPLPPSLTPAPATKLASYCLLTMRYFSTTGLACRSYISALQIASPTTTVGSSGALPGIESRLPENESRLPIETESRLPANESRRLPLPPPWGGLVSGRASGPGFGASGFCAYEDRWVRRPRRSAGCGLDGACEKGE